MNVGTTPPAVPCRRPCPSAAPRAPSRCDASEWEELDDLHLPGWDGAVEGLLLDSSRRLHAAAAADLLSR